jgi:transposase-like protein
MGRQHLSEDERRRIVERYIAGDKISVIAMDFCVHEKTIRRVRRKAAVPVRWHRNCGPRTRRDAGLPLDAGANLPYG